MTLVKYPRTPHLPWSQGATTDDITLKRVYAFEGKEVVVTEKMDGENTTMYRDHIHARSLDSAHHPSRAWVKTLHGSICQDIPEGWRVCGENLYAEHSISYRNLPSYFLVFSIWTDKNECLSWQETEEWSALLGLSTVPVLYRGPFAYNTIRNLYNPDTDSKTIEGYVVRLESGFDYKDFTKSVAKFVRKNHVQTDEHWMSKPVTANGLQIRE